MCGFAGVIHWNREKVIHEDLEEMVCRLKHRGPDELCMTLPKEWVGLVHARLKVIDLSEAARQPMSTEDGTIWILYNGEVYNFQELRLELQALGCRFRSQSDTEVVLRAYEVWGVEAIRRLDGMFAYAIWDSRREELLLGRDRTGKKPLFYWTNGPCFVFGSEIKGLLAHGHVPCDVNEEVLPHLLAFGYSPTGQTCYRQIRQMPPATFLRLKKETGPVLESYWDLRLNRAGPQVDFKEAEAGVRQRLKEAVRKRLIADVPLGAFLSGGVDSSIVVGLMSEAMPGQPVKTFSIGFEGDTRFDETRYAKIVAHQFRTDHTSYRVTPQSFDLLERLVWYHDQPFGDSSAVPTYLLSQLTRRKVTVALTGDGGDELFGGYSRFAATLWAEKIPQGILSLAERFLRFVPAGNERFFIARIKRFLEGARLALPERYEYWTRYIKDTRLWFDRSGSLLSNKIGDPASFKDELWKRSAQWSSLSRLLYLNFKDYLPNDLLVKMDRCSMAHGLEVRSPFLDTCLIEYVAGLPDQFKLRGWQTKRILRQAFRSFLPAVIWRRQKMGFGVPLGTWFRKQWREPLQDYLTSSQTRIYRYVNHQRIKQFLNEHIEGTCDAGHSLWLLLTFEVWLRQIEQISSSRRACFAHPTTQQIRTIGIDLSV